MCRLIKVSDLNSAAKDSIRSDMGDGCYFDECPERIQYLEERAREPVEEIVEPEKVEGVSMI